MVFAVIGLGAVLAATPASAQSFCLQNNVFGNQFNMTVTGPVGPGGSRQILGSDGELVLDGSIRIGVGNGARVQWSKHLPNGVNMYFADVSFLGTGPGQVTRIQLAGSPPGVFEIRDVIWGLCGMSPTGINSDEEP